MIGPCVEHCDKPAVHCFKAYVGLDDQSALTEEIALMSANFNDGRAGLHALPDDPREVLTGSAYWAATLVGKTGATGK